MAKSGRLYRAKNVLGHEIESSRRTDHTEDRGRVFFVDITILVHSMLFAGLVARKRRRDLVRRSLFLEFI